MYTIYIWNIYIYAYNLHFTAGCYWCTNSDVHKYMRVSTNIYVHMHLWRIDLYIICVYNIDVEYIYLFKNRRVYNMCIQYIYGIYIYMHITFISQQAATDAFFQVYVRMCVYVFLSIYYTCIQCVVMYLIRLNAFSIRRYWCGGEWCYTAGGCWCMYAGVCIYMCIYLSKCTRSIYM